MLWEGAGLCSSSRGNDAAGRGGSQQEGAICTGEIGARGTAFNPTPCAPAPIPVEVRGRFEICLPFKLDHAPIFSAPSVLAPSRQCPRITLMDTERESESLLGTGQPSPSSASRPQGPPKTSSYPKRHTKCIRQPPGDVPATVLPPFPTPPFPEGARKQKRKCAGEERRVAC